jgi:predicted transcriptional regulator of viral defense system
MTIYLYSECSVKDVNTIDLLQQLRRYPVFDLATFASVSELEPPSASSRLSRLVGKGYVNRLWRDAYTVGQDPLLVATHLAFPSYVSLWYAISHHGMTLQVPHQISVLTTMRTFRSAVDFNGTRIQFITILPEHLFGFEKLVIKGIEVFMATPEKAIVDAVLLRRISIGEVFSIMKDNIDRLDVSTIVDHVKLVGNGALAKRMGYLLAELGHDIHAQVKDMVYPTVVPLDTGLPGEGRVDRRWGLVDNVGVRT